jgi:hypothetical protein
MEFFLKDFGGYEPRKLTKEIFFSLLFFFSFSLILDSLLYFVSYSGWEDELIKLLKMR